MIFYQAQYPDNSFGEIRRTKNEVLDDLAESGYEFCTLGEEDEYDPNRNIGVAVIKT